MGDYKTAVDREKYSRSTIHKTIMFWYCRGSSRMRKRERRNVGQGGTKAIIRFRVLSIQAYRVKERERKKEKERERAGRKPACVRTRSSINYITHSRVPSTLLFLFSFFFIFSFSFIRCPDPFSSSFPLHRSHLPPSHRGVRPFMARLPGTGFIDCPIPFATNTLGSSLPVLPFSFSNARAQKPRDHPLAQGHCFPSLQAQGDLRIHTHPLNSRFTTINTLFLMIVISFRSPRGVFFVKSYLVLL